jgi:hypothetical protein
MLDGCESWRNNMNTKRKRYISAQMGSLESSGYKIKKI